MRDKRNRCFTRFAVAGAAGCLVTGIALLQPANLRAEAPHASPVKPPSAIGANENAWTRDDAAHLLRRAGFGGTPANIDALYALGRDAAVDYLLTGQMPAGKQPVFPKLALPEFVASPIPAPDAETLKASGESKAERRAARIAREAASTQPAKALPAKAQPAPAVAAGATPGLAPLSPDQAKKQYSKLLRRLGVEDLQRLRAWWVDRMVRTDNPLDEKMTLFWHGLFTSGEKEVRSPAYLEQEIGLFHREALGNYKQLTNDIVHSAAMIKYLNNDQNLAGRPNENLARELMELFTMGEGKGYTEADIKEVARALTGLAPAGGKGSGYSGAAVTLRENGHDSGMKTIFGKTRNFGPDDVVNLIFNRPEPARHLARKLWEFYVYPDPSDADLQPVVDALQNGNFEIKPALRALFTSPAFYGDKARFALIKGPAELMVEEVRTLGITPTPEQDVAIQRRLKEMDQELLQPPNVRGWVGGDNWITAATLYTRYNTASAVVNGAFLHGGKGGVDNIKKQGPIDISMDAAEGAGAIAPAMLFGSLGDTASPDKVVDAAIDRFLQRPLTPAKRDALLDIVGTEPLHLGNAVSDTRVRQMICLLLSTPEYQVH